LDNNFYSQKEVEDFVASVSPYTPILSEEPALAAEVIGIDGSIFQQEEFLEKPELAVSLPSLETEEAKSEKEPRRQIITYTVSPSDTLSEIATKFGLSVKTLADANNLSSVHQIKIGQILSIPPADGIIYTVSKGDTVGAVVQRYQGNLAETLKYTSENIKPGQKIVIVGGKIPSESSAPSNQSIPQRPVRLASASSTRNVLVREQSSGRNLGAAGSRNNGYPWGWCTWYAAYRKRVPSRWGNARSWLSSARRDGYAVGSVPKAGAIVVTTDSILGHVAYVESVSGNSILVSEMNYEGFGIISRRSIPIGSPIIRGYIY